MYKIFLINMPFADLLMPSLGLTQLKAILNKRYGRQVYIEIFYLNHDFARYIGPGVYEYVVNACISGLGDWFFRQAAFPQLGDNTEEYLNSYFSNIDDKMQRIIKVLKEKRPGTIRVLDALIAKYDLDHADIIGCTSMFAQNVSVLALAKRLKNINPEIIIAMGGANCESPMGREIAKYFKQIDFVFSGPALKSFPSFIQNCLDQKVEETNKIRGVFSKTNCEINRSSNKYFDEEGEELDINTNIKLDYTSFLDSFDRHFPGNKLHPYLFFETSRGCSWGEQRQCVFCGLNGNRIKYRVMNPQKAIRQFKFLFKLCSSHPGLWLSGVDSTMPQSYLKEVFPFLDTPQNVMIFYEARPNLLEEDLQILSKARINILQVGIESLVTSTLKLINKGTTALRNLLLLKQCLINDVYPVWNIMIGFPGENTNVYKKYVNNIPLLTHLPPPALSPLKFDRYSSYFHQEKDFGLHLQPVDFYKMVYPFNGKALANIAYYFKNCNLSKSHISNLKKWRKAIQTKVDMWTTRWHGKDGLLPSKLFFRARHKSVTVYDSRSGKVVEHKIGNNHKVMLDYLTKPKHIRDLHKNLNHISSVGINKKIAELRDRGLIFQEESRLISLVLPEEPPPMSFHLGLFSDGKWRWEKNKCK